MGWIAVNAGGAPKTIVMKLEGSRDYQVITPVFNSLDEASKYWFSQAPEKAWGIQEIVISEPVKEVHNHRLGPPNPPRPAKPNEWA